MKRKIENCIGVLLSLIVVFLAGWLMYPYFDGSSQDAEETEQQNYANTDTTADLNISASYTKYYDDNPDIAYQHAIIAGFIILSIDNGRIIQSGSTCIIKQEYVREIVARAREYFDWLPEPDQIIGDITLYGRFDK